MRIGAVSYLNTKPLIEGLPRDLASLDAETPSGARDQGGEALRAISELILDLPSRLADQLGAGLLDAALIPSVESFRHPDFHVVSDACIACHGPVWSVRLLFRVPPAQVRTVALDEGSRTSAALTQVLLYQRYGSLVVTRQLGIEEDFSQVEDVDAVLVIGDRAMHVDDQRYVAQWDLGEEWMRQTGLPFVFAMWVERRVGDDTASRGRSAELTTLLERARDRGLGQLSELAVRFAPQYQLTNEACERYFRTHLGFRLGALERQGLERFRQAYWEWEHAKRGGTTSVSFLESGRESGGTPFLTMES